MRRLILPLTLAALAAAASATALPSSMTTARVRGGEGLHLSAGRGYAVFGDRGVAFGNVRRGWIRITNVPGGGSPSGYVRGCESRSGRLSGRLYCSGTRLRFWVEDGPWRVRIKGSGINVSAVMRGRVGLDRKACSRRMFRNGKCTFEIGDGPARRWPVRLRFFAVRA
ncbi:MAG: hypothetical protein ACRDOG_16355 [Gaiellaceae bacterium]